ATGHAENVPQEVLDARKVYNDLHTQFKKTTDQEHERVLQVGGLHIIGTERHESRRIDNQLRGRAGRQGDPGSTQFFISLEDDVMRLFGSDKIAPIIERMGLKDDEPLEAGMLTKQIESAQKRIEGRNYDIRKHVLQYDDVMNQQREIMYGQRRQVLEGQNMRETILKMVDEIIADAVSRACAADSTEDWNFAALTEELERLCIPQGFINANKAAFEKGEKDDLIAALKAEALKFYEARETMLAELGIDMRELERVVLLTAVDRRWMDHIDAMDQLRDGIGLRAYAQRNPVVEYKLESFEMFDEMVRLIREDTVGRLYQAKIERAPERRQVARPVEAKLAGDEPPKPRKVKAAEKVGRNSPCPCGSGLKYKNCCGKAANNEEP
ncbi:MAG: SEC-C domain-containing protein, partial [Clostridia bacterium]|nr:SEC-C domain-containing protein [Clostridia bacterium]